MCIYFQNWYLASVITAWTLALLLIILNTAVIVCIVRCKRRSRLNCILLHMAIAGWVFCIFVFILEMKKSFTVYNATKRLGILSINQQYINYVIIYLYKYPSPWYPNVLKSSGVYQISPFIGFTKVVVNELCSQMRIHRMVLCWYARRDLW